MIYNFRFDRNNREEVVRRVRENKLLCQGWGGGENGGLSLEQEDYVQACRKFYGLTTTRIPTNLCKIRGFRNGDLIVTPHLPENGKASVHIVDGDFPSCYDYLDSDPFHLNNRFRVKASYGLDGQVSIYNALLAPWYGKLQWLRLPVLPIEGFEGIFTQLLEELESSPASTFPPSKIAEYFNSLTNDLLALMRSNLGQISPSGSDISFENVCEELIKEWGYSVTARNVFDRKVATNTGEAGGRRC